MQVSCTFWRLTSEFVAVSFCFILSALAMFSLLVLYLLPFFILCTFSIDCKSSCPFTYIAICIPQHLLLKKKSERIMCQHHNLYITKERNVTIHTTYCQTHTFISADKISAWDGYLCTLQRFCIPTNANIIRMAKGNARITNLNTFRPSCISIWECYVHSCRVGCIWHVCLGTHMYNTTLMLADPSMHASLNGNVTSFTSLMHLRVFTDGMYRECILIILYELLVWCQLNLYIKGNGCMW